MKLRTRILSILLALCLASGSAVSAFAADGYPKAVPEIVRYLDGVGEAVMKVFDVLAFHNDFGCEGIAPVYELDKNYVPQGFCYADSENLFAITYYSAGDDASILVLSDASTGDRVKTVSLYYADGTPCKAHVGGVADVADSLIVSTGKSVSRLKIADVLAAEDYSDVMFCGTLASDMQASFVNAYGSRLLVGQFYTFTPQNTYETPMEHHIYTPGGGRNYAMCEVFDLTDIDAVFEAGEAVPEIMISIPNNIQGVTYDGKYFAASASYMSIGSSKVRYYELGEPQGIFSLNGNDIPLYYLSEKDAVKTVITPPMAEGIDMYNGRVAGIFESGASKYTARVTTNDICVFDGV